MKVVVCSPLLSYPGHFLRTTLIKALCIKNAGLDVTVVAFRDEFRADFQKNNLSYASQESFLSVAGRKLAGMVGRHIGVARIVVLENVLVNFFAIKYARRIKADIVFITDLEPWIIYLLALFGLARRRDKIIGFIAYPFFEKSTAVSLPFFSYCRARLNHWFAPKLPRLIDVICDNKHHVLRMFGEGSTRIHVIPEGYAFKGISKHEKQSARQSLGLPPDKKLLLFFGVANENKGADLVHEALEGLEPIFGFLIIGTINTMFRPRNGLAEKRLEHWSGNIFRMSAFIAEDMRELYFAACDAVLLPYRKGYYTNTGSLCDAVSFGKAVLASDQYQVGYLVNNYRLGLTFQPEDIDSMRDCLREFVRKPDEWFAEVENNCKKLALEYSWANVGKIYCKTFEKICQGGT